VLVVDTGPLVATADRSDKDHATCRALLEGDEGPLVTTAMVIAEAAYLIDRQLGAKAEASLYDSILSGQLEVASLDREDWQRIAELVTTYASLRLGGTDASVITLAERLGTTRIATLNHRHFRVIRPRHAAAFELLP
jgi:predicted nucleic acid-binding protein